MRCRLAAFAVAVTACALAAVSGCGSARRDARLCPTLPAGAATVAVPTVILVTLDGVRARDVFDATLPLPNLRRLADRGVALGGPEAPMRASGPRFVSLPGYREILTGRRDGAGCRDNECPPIAEPTILDELRVAGNLGTDDVVVLASWETIARATSIVPEAVTISAGRRDGANRNRLARDARIRRRLDDGTSARAFPGHGDYRPDAWTAALALDVVAARHPRLLWVALGDGDEYAHRGDYAGYRESLVAADRFVGALGAVVGQDAIYIVTADHGRSANFRDHGDSAESSSVWLIAAGGDIPPTGHLRAAGDGATAAPRYLADIAPSLRALLHLAADPSPRAGALIPELLPRQLAAAEAETPASP
jgi:hypothetical protein